MNFFSKSPKNPPKKTKKSLVTKASASNSKIEEYSSTRLLRSQVRESSSSKPKVNKNKSDSNKSRSPGPVRVSQATPESLNLPRNIAEFESHPLNLHPDQLLKISALSNMQVPDSERMDEDTEASTAPPISINSHLNSPVSETSPKTNGNAAALNGQGPVPPPHRTNTKSPTLITSTVEEDAEIYKSAGNKYYKAKEYKKAIEEYTKGILIFSSYLFIKVASNMNMQN